MIGIGVYGVCYYDFWMVVVGEINVVFDGICGYNCVFGVDVLYGLMWFVCIGSD